MIGSKQEADLLIGCLPAISTRVLTARYSGTSLGVDQTVSPNPQLVCSYINARLVVRFGVDPCSIIPWRRSGRLIMAL